MVETVIARIQESGGAAFETKHGFVATIPLDGEWIFGLGPDLNELVEAMVESDGLASEADGLVIKPYLERDEAIAEMESFAEGNFVVLTIPSDYVMTPIVPSHR